MLISCSGSRRHSPRKIQIANAENASNNVGSSHSSSQSPNNSSCPTPDRSETVAPPVHLTYTRNLLERKPNARPSMLKLASPSSSLTSPPPIIYDTIEVMLEPPPEYLSGDPHTSNKRKRFKPRIRRSKRRRVDILEETPQTDWQDRPFVEGDSSIYRAPEDPTDEREELDHLGTDKPRDATPGIREVVMETGEAVVKATAPDANHDDEEEPRVRQRDSRPNTSDEDSRLNVSHENEDTTDRTLNEPPIPLPLPGSGESVPESVSDLPKPPMPVVTSAAGESNLEHLADFQEQLTFPPLRTLKHVSIPATPEPDDFHDEEESMPLSATKSHHSEDINDWLITDVEQSMEEETDLQLDRDPKDENLEQEAHRKNDESNELVETELQMESMPPSPGLGEPRPMTTTPHPREEVPEESRTLDPAIAPEERSIGPGDPSVPLEPVSDVSEVAPLETEIINEMVLDSDVESENEIIPRFHTHSDPISMLIDESRTGVVLESPSPPLRTIIPRRIVPRPILPAPSTGTVPILPQTDAINSAITTRESSRTPVTEPIRSSVPLHDAPESARSSPSPFPRPNLSDLRFRRPTRRAFEPAIDLPRRTHFSLDIASINASSTASRPTSPESLPTPPVDSPSPVSRAVSPSFGLRTAPRPMVRPPLRPTRGGLRCINHDSDPRSKLLMARPKIAIPSHIPPSEYARECLDAAIFCRLPPYSLDPAEHKLFRTHINHVQVTTYLNIRNGILRMWMLNPAIAICREEALGVAKEDRHLEMTAKCHEFLVRHGYINFGCIRPPRPLSRPLGEAMKKSSRRQKRVVVIGAGAAGLGCARQLESLFIQLGDRFPRNEDLPEVIVLEGRDRVGGRIYSHPLTASTVPEASGSSSMSNSKSSVSTVSHNSSSSSAVASLQDPAVDLGAQIVTGFENGNPLAPIIKRQLQLRWHHLHDDSRLFDDQDGARVDTNEDQRAEKLFNDILDRASAFKERVKDNYLIEGDRELMDQGKEPHGESGRQIAKVEENEAVLPPMPPSPPLSTTLGSPGSNHGSPRPDVRKIRIPARRTLAKMGLNLKYSDPPARKSLISETSAHSTLGEIMKSILGDIQELVDLDSMDMKLLNWHWANLEYGNATNLNNLSLKYWDQDDANEYFSSIVRF